MQQKFIEISVGLLMLAGIAAVTFLALQVSARGFSQNQAGYDVAAYFTNAAGLTDKAKVSLAGVTIGHVESIEIVPASMKAKVAMKIDKDVNYLSSDSTRCHPDIRRAGREVCRHLSRVLPTNSCRPVQKFTTPSLR